MIVMGAEMDWASLKEGANAHVKAIEGMDAKGVLKQGDLEAILAGIGKAISSVSSTTTMGVYNEMRNLIPSGSADIPQNLFGKQSPADAIAAYSALMEFKDTVRQASIGESKGDYDKSLDKDAIAQTVGFIAFSALAVL